MVIFLFGIIQKGEMMLDLAIIGGGPAGLTAGLYATRGGLKNVTMFEMRNNFV